jgi:hypothetical protein
MSFGFVSRVYFLNPLRPLRAVFKIVFVKYLVDLFDSIFSNLAKVRRDNIFDYLKAVHDALYWISQVVNHHVQKRLLVLQLGL